MGATIAKEVWDTLQEEFQGFKKGHAVKLQYLRRDFENLKIKDNEAAKDYYSRIKELVNQMRAYGQNIIDKKIEEKILISCIEKYDSVIFTIEESKDTKTLIPTELMGSLEEKVPLRLILKKEKRYISENKCCPIQWRYAIDISMKAQAGESWLWYKRFGHFNFHGSKMLQHKNMMRDLTTIKEMDETCEWYKGVQHQLTVGYTPEQNSKSERNNRIVMETTRAMLTDKGLHKYFWAKAVYTAVYLLNRCPTNTVKDKILVEAYSGRKPSSKHLRVFGCICYAHIPQEKRNKLDEKIGKGIFLGYSTQSKGYRVYNLRTKKLIISKDVQFDKDAMYNWETKKIKRKSINLPTLPQ
ncbi:hypothetical protein UlMin_027235 [Ulmus minor]